MTDQQTSVLPPNPEPASPAVEPPVGRRPRRRARRALLGVGLVALVVGVPTAASYEAALTAPGAGPWSVATVTWLDDHGFAPVVNAVETIIYSLDAPASTGTVTPGSLPQPPAVAAGQPLAATPPTAGPPPPVASAVSGPTLPGEGQWRATGAAVAGGPAAWTTFFRPDPGHTGVLAGALRLDQTRTVTALAPGSREPGPVVGALPSSIPQDLRGSLVSTFGAGFRFRDHPGGFFLNGQTMQPLVPGQASMVIGTDGRVDIRAWSDGATPAAGVVAVRQNLALVVQNGAPVGGLAANADQAWGKAGQQNEYTMRTGAGITANGDLVVVEGGLMTLPTLADTLVQAGAVTGMQLDIHKAQVSVDTFAPDPASAARTRATALLPDQQRPADRFLTTDQRDFFAVFAAGTALPGAPR